MPRPFIIGVDFDGTCVDHQFPDVGHNVPEAAQWLRHLTAHGASLILWTVRSEGERLNAAVSWFEEEGIPLWGICENPTQKDWSPGPKAYCNVYIDDAAYGCPLIHFVSFHRPCVDWSKAGPGLFGMLQDFMRAQGQDG